jgi:hypothetical protein
MSLHWSLSFANIILPVTGSLAENFAANGFPYSDPQVLEKFSAIRITVYYIVADTSGRWRQAIIDQV